MQWTESQRQIQEEMERLLLKKPAGDRQTGTLFHYTSARGLLGIIEKGEIWATHFDHMNDRRELRIGEDIVREEARKLLLSFRADSLQYWILNEIVRVEPHLRLTKIASVYIASLTEHGDLLSQWRAYGSDGSGYSIGLKGLPNPTDDRPTADAGLFLVRCEYDKESFGQRISAILREVVTGFEPFVRRYEGNSDLFDAIHHSALSIAYRRVAAEIPRLKDRAFIEESEWRLVAIPMSGLREAQIVKFRQDRDDLTPYLEIGLGSSPGIAEPASGTLVAPTTRPTARPKLALASVIVGPSLDPTRSEKAARLLLAGHGYDPDIVRVSEAPYRGVRKS